MKSRIRAARNYALGAFLCFSIVFHAVTIIHELIGHGLAAVLMGGTLTDIYISWMGASGSVSWTGVAHGSQLITWAGIMATGITGMAAWLIWKNWFRYTLWDGMLVWLLSFGLLTSSCGYMILGLHYGYGDMAAAADVLRTRNLLAPAVWGLIMGHAAVVFLLSRPVVIQQYKWFRLEDWRKHAFIAVVILGSAAAGIALLNRTEDILAAKQEYKTVMRDRADREAETVVADLKRARAAEGKPMPALEAEARFEAAARELRPWPILWGYIPILLAASLAGIRAGRSISSELERPLRVPLWLWLATAAGIAGSGLLSLM